MKTVLILACLILAVFGLSEFMHILKLYQIFPKPKLLTHIVVDLKNETATKQIRYICEQYLWYGKRYADFIVFDATSLDDENYIAAKTVAEKYGFKINERI